MHKIVSDILRECVEADASFSSYDIIVESRERGCKLLKHEIEDIIQDYDKYPRYYKTSEVVGPNGDHILIRHPANVSAMDYDMSDIKETRISKPQLSVDMPTITGQSRASIIKKCSLFDTRNRFGVPASDVKAAGFSIGESLALVYDTSNRIVIMPEHEIKDPSTIRTTQTVTRDFGIRIRKRHFENTYQSVPSDIKVEISPRKLTLIPSNS